MANLWAFIDDHDEQFDAETNTFVCPGCKRRTNEGSAGDETLIGDACCDTCWWGWQESARRTCVAIAIMRQGQGRIPVLTRHRPWPEEVDLEPFSHAEKVADA